MLHSVRELFRFRIVTTDRKIGKADDFYFDDATWRVRYVGVNTGRWLPSNRVIISPKVVGNPNPTAREIPVSLSEEEVSNSMGPEAREPVSAQQERLLRERYGDSPYSRGGGPVGKVHGVVQREAVAVAETERGEPSTPDKVAEGTLRSAREVIGYQVETTNGPQGGLEDFLLDDETWVLPYLVVNTKDVRVPNPRVLAPTAWVQNISWSETRVHLRVSREKLKHSQRYDPQSHSPHGRPKPFVWP